MFTQEFVFIFAIVVLLCGLFYCDGEEQQAAEFYRLFTVDYDGPIILNLNSLGGPVSGLYPQQFGRAKRPVGAHPALGAPYGVGSGLERVTRPTPQSVEEHLATPTREDRARWEEEKENARELLGIEPEGPFAGKVFVFTGVLCLFDRRSAQLEVEQLGGRVAKSVSKRTDYIVAGHGAGGKLDRARELGTTILTEEGYVNLVAKELYRYDAQRV